MPARYAGVYPTTTEPPALPPFSLTYSPGSGPDDSRFIGWRLTALAFPLVKADTLKARSAFYDRRDIRLAWPLCPHEIKREIDMTQAIKLAGKRFYLLSIFAFTFLLTGCENTRDLDASNVLFWMGLISFGMAILCAFLAIFGDDDDRRVIAGGVGLVFLIVCLIIFFETG